MAVNFHFQSTIHLADRSKLKAFLSKLCKLEGRILGELNYVFVNDQELLDINRRFLNHDFYTDIITFDLREEKDFPISGEIYISTDRVKDNARTFQKTIKNELHRVIFHGLLHLCGYADKTPKEEKKMREREDYYLAAYFK